MLSKASACCSSLSPDLALSLSTFFIGDAHVIRQPLLKVGLLDRFLERHGVQLLARADG
jgi:hypothetical protein